ncbi:DnaJ-domain-containing protein [Xylaria acuta]|nr:DnaJ-domain-containing protein [Xylaria acuta]
MVTMDEAVDPPSTPDYYRDLGVSQTANAAAIREAFTKLALATHPDKNVGKTNGAADFRKVHEAYEFLSDPEKRASYDRTYLRVQRAWARYYERQKEQSRRGQLRLAKEAVAEERSKEAAGESRAEQEGAISMRHVQELQKLNDEIARELARLDRVIADYSEF